MRWPAKAGNLGRGDTWGFWMVQAARSKPTNPKLNLTEILEVNAVVLRSIHQPLIEEELEPLVQAQ